MKSTLFFVCGAVIVYGITCLPFPQGCQVFLAIAGGLTAVMFYKLDVL